MIDASQGYHQIMLASEDHKRVSFITSNDTFCYVAMPFGLKNAGATYQRMVDKVFQPQLGRNIEVYVDNMLVKSKEAHDHVKDLNETFAVLRKYRLKLNPGKCTFRVSGGRFLGFIVTQRGLPFFKTLRKVKNFEWTKECQQAFEDLKAYLAKLPLLVKPVPGDTLYLYISTPQVVSSVLVREEEGNQTPIYYVSKVLNGAESCYPPIERMALALVIIARKLRPYFLSHPVGVRTNTPTTIKAQALPDFVSEMIGTTQDEVPEERPWLLHVDGSSTPQGSGAGIVVTTPHVDDMEFTVKFKFKASNNEAEYEALVLSMRMAQDTGASHLLAYSDSQLIVKQINGEYEAKEESMVQYLQQIEELKTKFKSFLLHQIPREENIKTNSLSKIASALEDCKTRRITVQHLPQTTNPTGYPAHFIK
ncbi:UNVERIFIED_CONTAM: Ribonuclease HI [Sesamum latifolium]|uniref:Ribonuclease HI n=1 Tax=Sesamum latifolium TaxID=2727402 RepID=A0AAW2UET3_9LAMI